MTDDIDSNGPSKTSLANLVSRYTYDVSSVNSMRANTNANFASISSSFIGQAFGSFVQHVYNGVVSNANNDIIINQKLAPLNSSMSILDSIKGLDANINVVDNKVRVLNQDVKRNTDLASSLLDFSKKLYNSYSQANAQKDYERFKKTENKYELGFSEKELEDRLDRFLSRKGYASSNFQ